jgi:hypothetical protein
MAESVLGVVAGFALWLGVSALWALLAGASETTSEATSERRSIRRRNAGSNGR